MAAIRHGIGTTTLLSGDTVLTNFQG